MQTSSSRFRRLRVEAFGRRGVPCATEPDRQIAAPTWPNTNVHRANDGLINSANGSMATGASPRVEHSRAGRSTRPDLLPLCLWDTTKPRNLVSPPRGNDGRPGGSRENTPGPRPAGRPPGTRFAPRPVPAARSVFSSASRAAVISRPHARECSQSSQADPRVPQQGGDAPKVAAMSGDEPNNV